ncbi:MAG: SPOR domain-containing protein [Erythrobacter sp.]|uniref:SPOR domain-containing protein n=1 Tax=Erythrobacter sp. TaxID=1042 RepID=UPI002B4A90B3|nr:tetratricopeptide repeat protein [Erythrobacter sp.]WRH71826.1 MAG: SPOR domain-containing protein [Erythrobacter sp.]
MDRSIKTGFTAPRLALAVTTALAGLALVGCSTAAPRGDMSFASAQTALAKGQTDKAIIHAEAAVLAEPRNPGFRALLGAAYLEAGRFQSAATSFEDALDLGNEDPRTVLSLALARTATGDGKAAVKVLDDNARLIDPADLGLAYALAGQPERGVHVLINAVRSAEQATPKLRQNLAYTYALAGNWRAARVMAAEDVPADQLDARLTEWALMSAPEHFQQRVATMLGVTPRADDGQPQQLALANFPAQEVMVAEAATQADAPVVAVASPAPAPVQAPVGAPVAAAKPSFAEAFAQPVAAPAARPATARGGIQFVSNPVVQELPARPAARVAQRRMAATAGFTAPAASGKDAGTHLVQLGAYSSKVEAERGWTVLKGKFPQLKDRNVVITEAVVGGRTFWRVAAEGFGKSSAQAMCGTVKSAGRGCFAYAASSPPAGAVDRGVRMASRAR